MGMRTWFAQSDSAFYGMNREWWRDKATIVDGVLTMTGFRIFRYAFDGARPVIPECDYRVRRRVPATSPPEYWSALTWHALPGGDRPTDWPWPGERVLDFRTFTVRTPDGRTADHA